jgi:hypothetical protein
MLVARSVVAKYLQSEILPGGNRTVTKDATVNGPALTHTEQHLHIHDLVIVCGFGITNRESAQRRPFRFCTESNIGRCTCLYRTHIANLFKMVFSWITTYIVAIVNVEELG